MQQVAPSTCTAGSLSSDSQPSSYDTPLGQNTSAAHPGSTQGETQEDRRGPGRKRHRYSSGRGVRPQIRLCLSGGHQKGIQGDGEGWIRARGRLAAGHEGTRREGCGGRQSSFTLTLRGGPGLTYRRLHDSALHRGLVPAGPRRPLPPPGSARRPGAVPLSLESC